MDITVRQQNSGGKQVEGVKLVLPLPANTLNVAINVNYGSYEYDVTNKVLETKTYKGERRERRRKKDRENAKRTETMRKEGDTSGCWRVGMRAFAREDPGSRNT